MTLSHFRRLVQDEFGHRLEYMTPANVREFLDRVQTDMPAPGPDGRIRLNEPERTYEGIVRDFLQRVLEMPSDQAVIRLWLYCLELASASVSELEAERFAKLFASNASPESGE